MSEVFPKPSHLEEVDALTQSRRELADYLKSFTTESAAFSTFEKYSGMTRKTLKAFLESNRRPYPKTLFAFYKWYFKTSNDKEVTNKLSPKLKKYLLVNGHEVKFERKDIAHIVCKSSIHYELYLMTEDNQIITKDYVLEFFGKRGLDALNELVLENVISAIDENNYSTGLIRAKEDIQYNREATKLFPVMFPWDKLEENALNESAGYSFGNFLVRKDRKKDLHKAFRDFCSKVSELHEDALKEKSPQNKSNYLYSLLMFNPGKDSEEGQL